MPIHTEVEIQQSPEQVRKVLLDFPSYPSWTPKGFIKSITPADPAVAPGSKLRCVLQGMTFAPTVVTNSAGEFAWRGQLWGLPGLFTGVHSFRFEPSRVRPGGTTFVHAESFSGALSFMIAEGTGFWKSTRDNFEAFNVDLKARCESEK